MRLVVSDAARADLIGIWAYIARHNPAAADAFLDRLYAQCQQLAGVPGLGRTRDELLPGLRSLPVARYVIFYRVTGEALEIARVLSAYRDIDALF
ncbi:MAG: hypothetical protein A3K19_28665 [Lentisphaerae bacterium RIFOXYB12_FULL_65_16]|nr:MAG: hypothetical protein A3K18_25225 [Lentisphaerae bacterium RIFOXYA12_64_32]OGV89684.1 MAG: hypothetical protein A3K19_28665 [Lentisphaerae bacterium RIFOXYB12_FULL_65_16]